MMSLPCKWPFNTCCHGNPPCYSWYTSHLSSSVQPSLSFPPFLLFFPSSAHQKKACSERLDYHTSQLQNISKPLKRPTMPEVAHMPSMKPPPPGFNVTLTTSSLLTTTTTTTTTLLPREEWHMQVHTILIVVIFCVVCFLLLLAFFYAFCFHCSIGSLPKDSRTANGCSLDREDATFKRSSSDNQSMGNVV